MADYFKNDKGVSLGHLVCIGENKKLDKHFLQVEMKSGKEAKRMSNSQKEANMGMVYFKTLNDSLTLCFEPDPKSKIPQGKWPKLLKELKAFLAGYKAVAVFDGQIVDDTTEVPQEETGEVPVDETQKEQRGTKMRKMEEGILQMEQVVGKAPKIKLTANVEQYQNTLEALKKEALKDGVIDQEEQAQIDALTQKIERLQKDIEERGARLKPEHLEKMNTNLDAAELEIDKMLSEWDD